jgi:hypothetical protein
LVEEGDPSKPFKLNPFFVHGARSFSRVARVDVSLLEENDLEKELVPGGGSNPHEVALGGF